MSEEKVRYKHAFYPVSAPESVEALPGDTLQLVLDETNNLQDVDQIVILVSDSKKGFTSMYRNTNCGYVEALGLMEWAKVQVHTQIMNDIEAEFYDDNDTEEIYE